MQNAKNTLYEFVKELGYPENRVQFLGLESSPNGNFKICATVVFDDGRQVSSVGTGLKKLEAEIAACINVLSSIQKSHKDLLVDWKQVFAEAQAGDALIKLCAYLSDSFETSEQKSLWLQTLESDNHLAQVFDSLKRKNDPLVAKFGSNLGTKKKATLIEALIWQRFGNACLSADVSERLKELAGFLKGYP